MAATVAADPELLARPHRPRPGAAATRRRGRSPPRRPRRAPRRARTWSGPWSSPPGLGLPGPPPVPPVPPAVEQVIDEVWRSARYLVELVARSEQRFRAAERVGRLGTPLLRSLPRLAPPLVAALPSDPLTWLEQLLVDSSPAFLLLDHGAARSREVGSGWWVVDAWQALEGGVGLALGHRPRRRMGRSTARRGSRSARCSPTAAGSPSACCPSRARPPRSALTFGDVAALSATAHP